MTVSAHFLSTATENMVLRGGGIQALAVDLRLPVFLADGEAIEIWGRFHENHLARACFNLYRNNGLQHLNGSRILGSVL